MAEQPAVNIPLTEVWLSTSDAAGATWRNDRYPHLPFPPFSLEDCA